MMTEMIRSMAGERLDAAVNDVIEREIVALTDDGASEATILRYVARRSRQLATWRAVMLAQIVANVQRGLEHPDAPSLAVH